MIPNHIAPKLSALDLEFARWVRPGGNWKDIPDSVPSRRLVQIRDSFARGEGSRSTYYGRLLPAEPAYTVNTYFSRPGNGCHFHYDKSQDRTLSYREAARLQSFPDSFIFEGSAKAVATQIGNAVPPVMAYCLARALGPPGKLVDLFAGAGGLSLGFQWAGWESLVGSDIDVRAMQTFARNIHPHVVVGDIRTPEVRKGILGHVSRARRGKAPLVLVGGPPCQGFSTAGNRRTRTDERNQLFRDYCDLVDAVSPDAFLFENVTGLLNMEGGSVFRDVIQALESVCREVRVWRVAADEYGVPQRRKRVIVVGFRTMRARELPPGPLTDSLFGGAPVSVEEALSDLPPLVAGEDGTSKDYKCGPSSGFQKLMRGTLSPQDFVEGLAVRTRSHAIAGRGSRRRRLTAEN